MKKLLLVSLFLISSICIAEDDCVRNTPKPIGIAEHAQVKEYKISTNKEGHFVEEINLKSGQHLYISQYGCAHFGLEYKFGIEKIFEGNLIIQAKKYLKLVSLFAPRFTKRLSKSMSKVPDDFATPELITLEPGYDWIYLSTKKENNEYYFIISYDIAL